MAVEEISVVCAACGKLCFLLQQFRQDGCLEVITSIVIYLCALRMEKLGDAEAAALHRKKPDGTALLRPEKKALKAAFKRKRKALLTFGLLIIFGILAFFKYIPGLISGISGGRFTMNLLLPIGISFYTFQSAGYLIDVG